MKNKSTKNKHTGKQPTEFSITCNCAAKAKVYSIGDKGYMAHCPACGALIFFRNVDLLERLNYGGSVCPHKVEAKSCTGGKTTWCPVCRVRIFYPNTV
jgi:DNA-directed RNA polymerase subunit RPC12/RpoP